MTVKLKVKRGWEEERGDVQTIVTPDGKSAVLRREDDAAATPLVIPARAAAPPPAAGKVDGAGAKEEEGVDGGDVPAKSMATLDMFTDLIDGKIDTKVAGEAEEPKATPIPDPSKSPTKPSKVTLWCCM